MGLLTKLFLNRTNGYTIPNRKEENCKEPPNGEADNQVNRNCRLVSMRLLDEESLPQQSSDTNNTAVETTTIDENKSSAKRPEEDNGVVIETIPTHIPVTIAMDMWLIKFIAPNGSTADVLH